MMGLKPKVGVKDVIGVIPKMATTFLYVRRFKKILIFPLYLESAVIFP